MPKSPRQRMIQGAALLMRERGVEATSFSSVLEFSGAPRGSIYHHFPGGKAQLIQEATEYAGEFVASGIAMALSRSDPLASVEMFADTWRELLSESDYGSGCPVVAATLEGDRSPGARDAAGAAFMRWQDLLSQSMQSAGISRERAASLAAMTVASIEGAVILSRAEHSTEPLDRVVDELRLLIRAAVAQGAPARVSDRAPASAPTATASATASPDASPNVKPAANASPQP